MKTTSPGRWVVGAAGLGAALLLGACNPLPVKPFIPSGPTWSTAKFRYDGPADAWVEVRVTGVDGYQVSTRTAVWVPQDDPPQAPVPRQCRSATDRTVVVTCNMGYPEFPHTDLHPIDQDAPGTYWPAILVHPGEQAQVMVYCAQSGSPAVCPPATTVWVRSVDVGDQLVGDLQAVT